MRHIFSFARHRSGRWFLASLLLALILGVIARATPVVDGAPSPTTQQRHRLILVPGICSTGPVGTEQNPKTFQQIYRWLADELGYQTYRNTGGPADIFGFSYATANTIKMDPETISYDAEVTKASIATVHVHRLRDLVLALRDRYPGETFDIIAHSMGGVVALYSAATYRDVRDSLHSIVTINSPVQGISRTRMMFSSVLPCIRSGNYAKAIDDMYSAGEVMAAIRAFPWNQEVNHSLFVATIANKCDPVVTTLVTEYPGADLGILEKADYQLTWTANSYGCSLRDLFNFPKMVYEHGAPLLVNTNPAAAPTKDALTASLILHHVSDASFGAAITHP